MGPWGDLKKDLRRYKKICQKVLLFTACRFCSVGGVCYVYLMNTLEEIQTQVFCSQCDFVTSNFVEWAGEFYCEEACIAYLPTEASMEEQDFGDPDHEWLVSAGWGDDEDY